MVNERERERFGPINWQALGATEPSQVGLTCQQTLVCFVNFYVTRVPVYLKVCIYSFLLSV